MDEKIILKVLSEQQEEVRAMQFDSWCSRKEEKLFEMNSNLAQVVIGVRRSGKSTLCHKVLLQHGVDYGYVNCDDDRLLKLQTEDLDTLLNCIYQLYGTEVKYLFLDEIQNVEGWHLFVNRLLRVGLKVFVTGSNARLLSSELATHLTGRYNEIRLFPFSFSEYCIFKNVPVKGITTKADAKRKIALNEYLQNGGFPELLSLENKHAYVNSLIESVIIKDIKQRYRIRNVESLRMMANHLINNICQEINYDSIAENLNIGSQTTAKKYADYLRQAFLIQTLTKFSYKSRERMRSSKCYVVDTGLISNRDNALLQENIGWRLENTVFIELLRRTAHLYHDVYYYKPTSRSKEVDFVVCERGRVLQLIQVAYDIDTTKAYKRETESLLQASVKLNCSNLILLTMSQSREEEFNGKTIKIINIIEWLLG